MRKHVPNAPLQPETLALHAGFDGDPTTHSRAVPIYQTSSFLFDNAQHAANLFALEEFGNIYSRIMNPTNDVFERRVAALEGGTLGVAASSGQAAETMAMLALCEAGDHIVSSSSLYGGTFSLLGSTFKKLGIEVSFVDSSDPENFRKAATPKTKVFFGETVGNPRLDTLPIAEVAAIGKELGIPLVVDNTLPSPYLVKPLEHGANIVVHSATKFLGGHGNSIAGVIVDGGNFDWSSGRFPSFTEPDPSYGGIKLWEKFGSFGKLGNIAFALKVRLHCLRDLGSALSPFNSFLLLQGIETLHIRMERHSANAMRVAEFLEGDDRVSWVNYPGLPSHADHQRAKQYHTRGMFGAMVGFGIRGGYDSAVKFIDACKLFSLLANVGDAKSLVIHPASTTHQQLSEEDLKSTGVTADFVRLSVGIEHIDDILGDLDQALSASQS